MTFAEDLIQCVALHIAETLAGLLQHAMKDDACGLVDSKNAPLLCPKFWLQPVYTELLKLEADSGPSEQRKFMEIYLWQYER